MSEKEKILAKVEELTSIEAFRIRIDKEKKPALTDSKLGGFPYWDREKPYPMSSKGEKLFLLTQINFGELPKNEVFPKEGLLQFFVACDDVYGVDFDSPDRQEDFRVVFHQTIKPEITKESLSDLNLPMNDMESDVELPFSGELGISFEKTMISMGVEDYRYMEKVKEAAELLGELIPSQTSAYGFLKGSEFEKEEKNIGHWLLGYPYFTQGDPRDYKEELRKYDTLLFQLDSEFSDESGYEIIWGDSGVANFFISKEALKCGDFSQIMYTWDCC